MDVVKDFLVSYWPYISVGIVVILDIIIMVIKKKPFDPTIYSRLVLLIGLAEKEFGEGHGEEKLNFVIDEFLKDSQVKYSKAFIASCVETILSLPTKKGGFGREKVK